MSGQTHILSSFCRNALTGIYCFLGRILTWKNQSSWPLGRNALTGIYCFLGDDKLYARRSSYSRRNALTGIYCFLGNNAMPA